MAKAPQTAAVKAETVAEPATEAVKAETVAEPATEAAPAVTTVDVGGLLIETNNSFVVVDNTEAEAEIPPLTGEGVERGELFNGFTVVDYK